MLLVPRARSTVAPRWLVRSGNTVVGPVPTALLVRGVSEGRVPRESLVRDERSLEWRRLEQVRELSSASPVSVASRVALAADDLADARDEGEVLSFLLHGAVEITSSALGALHRAGTGDVPTVTSCVLGLTEERLGQSIAIDDPILRLARTGECLHGDPSAGYLQQTIAERLVSGADLTAVIMAPVLYGTELVAVLELGRSDHAYRQGDADALLRLCAFAVDRLEALSG